MVTTTAKRPLLTARDLELLAALEQTPLTALQVLRLSKTFSRPFTTERRVRERVQELCAAGRVRRERYATADRGAPNYYLLTRLGFELLHGDSKRPHSRHAFSPIAISRQHHTHSLAEFHVHTLVSAHAAGFTVEEVERENALRLKVGDDTILPDRAFTIVTPDGKRFRYFVEVDASTERIRSLGDADSWERKITLYNKLQDGSKERFRVLVVTTRASTRLQGILAASAALSPNPRRSLFCGINLHSYVENSESLIRPCFRDHHMRSVALVPTTRPDNLGQGQPDFVPTIRLAVAT